MHLTTENSVHGLSKLAPMLVLALIVSLMFSSHALAQEAPNGEVVDEISVVNLAEADEEHAEKTLVAQDDPRQDPDYRDPSTAQLWGIVITGGGHFYSGETTTGAVLLGSAVGAPILGLALSGCDFESGCNWTPYYLGLGVTLGSWIYSIIDSPRAAERQNAERGLVSLPVNISPHVAHDYLDLPDQDSGIGYGLSFSYTF